MTVMKRYLVYFAFALSLFVFGVAVGRYELPPFASLRALKTTLSAWPGTDAGKHRSAYYLSHRSPYHLARHAMFQVLPGRADVIMLGDSITEFGSWQELFPTISILNRGIAGDTSYGVLERLEEITRRQPKTVFLMIGVNDFRQSISPEIVEHNIRSIVSGLSSSGITPIVQSTLFVTDAPEINAQIRRLDVSLRQWCADSSVTYIDLNPVLAPEGKLLPRYTWDGVHLNGDAYLQWRDIIAPHTGHRS